MNITVVGMGYVGLSVAVLLSQLHFVTMVDVDEKRIDAVNSWKSPIQDEYLEKYLLEHEKRGLSINATKELDVAVKYAD